MSSEKPLRVYEISMAYRMDGIADVVATSAAEALRLFQEKISTKDAYLIYWEQGPQIGTEHAKLLRDHNGRPTKP